MTKIEWTEETWNPIVGCSILSPGCTNCYAMKMAARIEAMGTAPHYAGTTKRVNGKAVWTGKLALAPERILTEPLRRRKPTMYFVNSMSDLFHEDVPDEWIDRVFAVMAMAPQHTFQVLTKRSDRMRRYSNGQWARREALGALMEQIGGDEREGWFAPESNGKRGWNGMCVPLPNVWLGVSTERQREADERIPDLLTTPAAVRFVSAEPLLGPVDFTRIESMRSHDKQTYDMNALRYPEARLDWIVVGGESGPGARPMHPDWARSIRDQCTGVGVPFFFKQWGNWVVAYDRDVDDPDWRRCPQPEAGTGRYLNLAGGCGFHGERVVYLRHVAKRRAGRLLDGREWNEMPDAAASTRRMHSGHPKAQAT